MDKNYLIIAGTNKAGTTSFFKYLADHRQVCPAYIKQTFFFLDKDWQQHWGMKSIYDFENGLEQFDEFFRDCEGQQFRLEATPDYLYAPECPERISQFLETRKGKVLLILRNPVKRFISLYYFGKQQGLIPADMDFATFRKTSESYQKLDNMSLIAYQTGFYSDYIAEYYEHFSKDQILIYFFEDLVKAPEAYMKKVASDIGLDPQFYQDYDFANFNTTVKVRSRAMEDAYNKMREVLIHSVYKTKLGYQFVEGAKKVIKPIYDKLNSQPLEKEPIPEAEIELLEKVYEKETRNLAELTGLEVPWTLASTI